MVGCAKCPWFAKHTDIKPTFVVSGMRTCRGLNIVQTMWRLSVTFMVVINKE